MTDTHNGRPNGWPRHGWFGLAWVAVFWPLNWLVPAAYKPASYLFFPLWLGYILVIDAWTLRRSGTSCLTRSRRVFLLQFGMSAPAWWLFEWFNERTRNWEYPGSETFSDLEYFLLCTVAFSTVMPAVFGTAEWVRTFRWVKRLPRGSRVPNRPGVWLGLGLTGAGMLVAVLLWPAAFYPLVWGSVFLILEPFNAWRGRPTLLRTLSDGDWRSVVALSVGSLVCGFFWECWNFYSYPKWIYHTPGAEFWYVFEMPLLGFIGYLPFAWELYALRHFMWPKAPELKI